MRLRTLPVSVAGVIAGTGCACYHHELRVIPMVICLLFAVGAQIASNFANEYYDYANGLDRKGREGFRRGVTEGDISPQSMKRATYLLLGITALIGLSLVYWGGIWLIAVGALIAAFALAYSAGPYPLSHHGLGDVAVVVFFGLVPVVFTTYVCSGVFPSDFTTWGTGLAIGLLAANVLIVNNYRDRDDDAAVGKRTTVVRFGRKVMGKVYLFNGLAAAIIFTFTGSGREALWTIFGWILLAQGCVQIWKMLRSREGKALNDVLKFTAMLIVPAAVYQLVLLTIWQA